MKNCRLLYDIFASHLLWVETDGKHGSWANLTGANLTWANLTGANLTGANLTGAIGNGIEVRSAQVHHTWRIVWTTDHLWIGCQSHSVEAWDKFNDDQIGKMHPEALEWWRKNKSLIMMLVKS